LISALEKILCRFLLMRAFHTAMLASLISASALSAREEPPAPLAAPPAPPPPAVVFEANLDGFDERSYAAALGRLLPEAERVLGRELVPGERGRVGLKVYSGGGAGLGTPRALVRALVQWLEKRGFERERIFLIDLYEHRIRDAGLLPPLATRDATFDGLEVRILDSGRWWDGRWYFDNPLPSRVDILPQQELPERIRGLSLADQRRSLMPAPLLFDVDFWINLPVASDHPAYGVNGALANATVWAFSNTLRFFRSRDSAPGVIAEMAAIPELRSTWVLNILSLERYQFVGGPAFNAFYTESEPILWVSPDPVLMDSLVRARLDAHRERGGFLPLGPNLPVLRFAERLGVGSAEVREGSVIRP
jgi:GNAT superfamily N-acetyltransferase